MYYLGIDLGTSGVKLLLSDEKGSIIKTASRDYPLIFPREGWSEQNPSDWVRGTLLGEGMISAKDLELIHVVDDPAEAVRLMITDSAGHVSP